LSESFLALLLSESDVESQPAMGPSRVVDTTLIHASKKTKSKKVFRNVREISQIRPKGTRESRKSSVTRRLYPTPLKINKPPTKNGASWRHGAMARARAPANHACVRVGILYCRSTLIRGLPSSMDVVEVPDEAVQAKPKTLQSSMERLFKAPVAPAKAGRPSKPTETRGRKAGEAQITNASPPAQAAADAPRAKVVVPRINWSCRGAFVSCWLNSHSSLTSPRVH
jgi:hypothetical protein